MKKLPILLPAPNFQQADNYQLPILKNNGFTVIEILIVISIAGLALASLMHLYTISIKTLNQNENKIKALNLATESLEITRAVRDESWNNIASLSAGAEYYPAKSDQKWTLVQGIEKQDIFSRKIIFEDVYRDTNDNIVESGGNLDSNTKKVTSTVFWPNQNINLVIYITNWK